jgi:hypothetical protein
MLVRAPDGSYAEKAVKGRFIPRRESGPRLGSILATDFELGEVDPA